jgi:RNA polymerase sigma-70 factor (ECF subfamily)
MLFAATYSDPDAAERQAIGSFDERKNLGVMDPFIEGSSIRQYRCNSKRGESIMDLLDDDSALQSFRTFRQRLIDGDQAAAQGVFEAYAAELIRIARSRLGTRLRQKVDPEDIVQSAFRSFFVKKVAAYDLQDWEGLLGMLIRITHRKCSRQAARFAAGKRSVNRESSGTDSEGMSLLDWATQVSEPTPQEAAELNDTIDNLFCLLDDLAKEVFMLRMQGFEIAEIAAQVDRTERTVLRKLSSARDALQQLSRS